MQSRGNGGLFDYYGCLGRHTRKTSCDLPYLPVSPIEIAIEDYYDTLTLGTKSVRAINEVLLIAAQKKNAAINRRAKRNRRRVLELEQERRKLLQGYLAGAVPEDLMKEERSRITSQLANAGAALASVEVHWEAFKRNLKAALSLATRFGDAYRLAGPSIRRWFNQAVFEGVYVDIKGSITRVELAQPFKLIYDQDAAERLEKDLVTARLTGVVRF